VHVIGKDILWFHTVYWPAMLFALGIPLPKTVSAHGWWIRGGKKAGKSTGGITTLPEIRDLVSKYGLDALRYHLLRAAPFGSDLEWSQEEFDKSYNELANVVGNCLNRVINMIQKYFDGKVPSAVGIISGPAFLDGTRKNLARVLGDVYNKLELQECVTWPVNIAREINAYIDERAPFKLAKSTNPADRDELGRVLFACVQTIYRVLLALLPVLPEKAKDGLAQLNVDIKNKKLNDLLETELPVGHLLGVAVPLFPKLESSKPS
jgi:methionyl-tRNA synthetase